MKKMFACHILFLTSSFFSTLIYSQNWSSWTSIQSDKSNIVQYCYRLNPVSSGNSFALKIKNNSLAVVCGEFEVNLNMVNGQKKVSYSFKDLKSGVEKSCPGVYQFADVQSFGSVTNVKINDCGESSSNSKTSPASFTIEYHNDASKGGTFKYVDPKGEYSFETKASSGHKAAVNNPNTQQFKNMGLIPSGTWYISAIKDKDKIILRLTPSANVVNPNNRDGFLIHGYNTVPEDASIGCIILEQVYREKLMKAFLRDGKIELKIANKQY
ncbi:MAG TPA: tlde1 domain-containing protein [Ferruginibacter sp.]|nr:tlde1 domain-containing protein [Ferruginibacter sp.]